MRTLMSVAAAALACVCAMGAAQAVTLSPKGFGQVLTFPYYTVNRSQSTLLSIVNVDPVNGKAFVVHFLEGYNGRQVSGLYVFLSPNDVWTASVTQTSVDGAAQILTADHSCTSPLVTAAVPFTSAIYDGTGSMPADGGPTSVTRTREGSIEVIETGDIPPQTLLYEAIVHVQNGEPGGGVPACTSGVINPGSADLLPPTGGLMGSAAIVNVEQGIFFAYNADALTGFTSTALNVPHAPTELFPPDLSYANSRSSSYAGGAMANLMSDGGDPLTLDYAHPIDAVSAVFMADTLYNEYFVDANLGAATDWIVTFPTKAFYVDPAINGGVAVAPFVESFGQTLDGESNVEYGATITDREEAQAPDTDPFPPTSHPTGLAYQTNALTFPASDPNIIVSAVFGSSLLSPFGPLSWPQAYGSTGWVRFGFAEGDGGLHVMRPDAAGRLLVGLPATGFMAYNLVNANAQPGLLANYSGAFPHRSTFTCMESTDGLSCR